MGMEVRGGGGGFCGYVTHIHVHQKEPFSAQFLGHFTLGRKTIWPGKTNCFFFFFIVTQVAIKIIDKTQLNQGSLQKVSKERKVLSSETERKVRNRKWSVSGRPFEVQAWIWCNNSVPFLGFGCPRCRNLTSEGWQVKGISSSYHI